MSEHILVVDDEKEIADLLEVYLRNDGYTVHKFYNGTEALSCIKTTPLDIALLDVMLPDIDGFRLLKTIRESYFFPVIMLTAKVADMDKIMGLTLGADDYITKPFNPLEVTARVKTQLRRYKNYNPAAAGPLLPSTISGTCYQQRKPHLHPLRQGNRSDASGIFYPLVPLRAQRKSGFLRRTFRTSLGRKILKQQQQYCNGSHRQTPRETQRTCQASEIHQNCMGSGVQN